MAIKHFTLNTGQAIPAIGLGNNPPFTPLPTPTTDSEKGTWQSPPGAVQTAVLEALKAGYRLIDCAYCYGNEEEVGRGLAEAFATGVVTREEVFVVTKVWATYTTRVELGLEKSLALLGLDYVDLFLVVRTFAVFFLGMWRW